MTWTEPHVLLWHGTTRQRAESIIRNGPDPKFQEPGGSEPANGFSTARILGPYPYGDPVVVATGKAGSFPAEGGAVILEMEVPQSIFDKANLKGEVRFDPGFGLEELLAAWPSIPKRILTL